MVTDNRKAAVLGAFVADALSLGAHWVYNTGVIDKKFGKVDRYHDPLTSYHTGKKAGEFTHYGDQMLVLLESLDGGSGFDALRFAQMWRTFFGGYKGYFDKATLATLENMDAGKGLLESGSDSDDLAGASRMAALVVACQEDPKGLVQAAREQTAVSHNNNQVLLCSDFFARCVTAVLGGKPPATAMADTLKAHFSDSPIASLILMGLKSRSRNTRETIAEFGQMCSVEAGLPSTVHLIASHGDSFETAMEENVMAGGDSSARGMLAGMLLGAAHGMAAIPDAWRSGLNAGGRITALLDRCRMTTR